ncbi:ferrochelatase [Candidatus Mycobacterium wuenschmannii]|uniref:Coproporphyrin III ferrochelatase n=1 Tax=Candidatus Mycobacterium wuenschmannii TaxID=3027808 RepID=A0ABY8VYL5_9MYCO|nr:ferrochelatase [Candidatus Mycobacterium wuenschmannii]WIM88693.1 ferrochelatase [Candidatus Mycobacterium wuenschmannii]
MDFDALLLLSFGGPEGPEQVRPFLENVTRGRNIPPERLDDVAQHYLHFGGVSPINGINRDLIVQLESQVDIPVYFGNRNWEPYVEDTVAAMRDNGIRRAAVFTTSAWSGYSGCTQYSEDLDRALKSAGPGAPELVKLRRYFDHPLFVEIFADNLVAAAKSVPEDARLVFTAHSVPSAADDRQGPKLYSRQVHYAARLVATAAGYDDYDVVWQSRSGPPQVPWLEPDVADHVAALTETGTTAVIVCPIGFVADHIEVVWDLDAELRAQTDAAGVALARVSTPNADPRFARLAVDLIDELRQGNPPARVAAPNPVPGCSAGINGEPCRPPHCAAEVWPT